MKVLALGVWGRALSAAALAATLVAGCVHPADNESPGAGTASGSTSFSATVAGVLLQIRSGRRHAWIVVRF